jgi:transposase
MEKKNKLINKVKRLIRNAGLPRWLHHFGPKKYDFWRHAIALIIRQECKLSYRRVSRLLNWLSIDVPTYSALAKMNSRLPLTIWQRLLQVTNQAKVNLAAMDATGYSRPLPSPYYYKRIDKPYPVEIPLKLSVTVDTKNKHILSLRLRSKNAHDIRDAKYLIKKMNKKPKKLIADKSYDAEWLHQFCKERGITAVIPARNYGKLKGFNLRRKCMENFKLRTYHRREIVESVFSSLKRKFGASVNSLTAKTRRAEIYCRAIVHNIFLFCNDFFNYALSSRKLKK